MSQSLGKWKGFGSLLVRIKQVPGIVSLSGYCEATTGAKMKRDLVQHQMCSENIITKNEVVSVVRSEG